MRSNPYYKASPRLIIDSSTKYVNNNISILGNRLKLPKLGHVTFAKSKHILGRILNVTIRKRPSGKFFVSILCEEKISKLSKTGSSIGIDLGISDFAVFSNGRKEDNHRFTTKMEKKLKREQRKLSRRALLAEKRGVNLFDAKNYQKQKRNVARLHEKVMNQRNDFLNKLTTDMIKNHEMICIEDLNTKGMMKSKKLAKRISDVSWSSFVSKLEYKADWYGKELIHIDRWFPSSQICSTCEHQDGKKPLHIREWTCSSCNSHHDRDVNASRNILAEDLRQFSLNLVTSVMRGSKFDLLRWEPITNKKPDN